MSLQQNKKKIEKPNQEDETDKIEKQKLLV